MRDMKERPILFSGPMVRAILEGRKTQTRRAVNPQPPVQFNRLTTFMPLSTETVWHDDKGDCYPSKWSENIWITCRYGIPGDRLWVRETWKTKAGSGYQSNHTKADLEHFCCTSENILYRATDDYDGEYRWRPSIHMPRWASRITLEITDVQIQRLQEISEYDAMAEGVDCEERGAKCTGWRLPSNTSLEPEECPSCIDGYVPIFERIWNSLNSNRGFSWDSNPWVWAITFKRIGQHS